MATGQLHDLLLRMKMRASGRRGASVLHSSDRNLSARAFPDAAAAACFLPTELFENDQTAIVGEGGVVRDSNILVFEGTDWP